MYSVVRERSNRIDEPKTDSDEFRKKSNATTEDKEGQDLEIESDLTKNFSPPDPQLLKEQQPPPKDGEYEYVDENGKRNILTYKDGELTGPIQIFDKAGNLELECVMENGQLNGTCKIYDSGILKSETEMLSNLPHGSSKQFDENGVLIAEIKFENGKKQGEMTQFHSNGEISTITTFTEDKMDGSYKGYNVGGELLMKSEYKNNKLQGLMENFYTGIDGNGIMRESIYENGQLAGRTVLYHSSGQILSESDYENGQLAKPTKLYPQPKK
jgi:antitoxin component YwqK of YwqJK toxin-antitoxin module